MIQVVKFYEKKMYTINMKLFHLAITLLVFIATSNSQSNIATDTMKENSIVRIMSYNIRHGSPIHHDIKEIHLDSIAAAINAQKPDLVALQEVDVNTGRSGQDLDEAKELGKLTGMNYFFSRSIDFDGGAYGVAVLSRVPIQEYQRFPLPMPDTTGEARSVAMVTVEVLPGIKIHFASTHLDLKVDNRMAQVNELIALSGKSKYPLIIAGDFNAFPNSGEIKNLREEFSFACPGFLH